MKTGDKRLLKLADILEKVPERKWDGHASGYYQGAVTHLCGTPSCAWGWWLFGDKRRYARISKADPFMDKDDIKFTLANWHTHLAGCRGYVSFMGNAAADEFGLVKPELEELFDGAGCGRAVTGKQAANYIRKFVARRNKKVTA